jgi:hypothetical protein
MESDPLRQRKDGDHKGAATGSVKEEGDNRLLTAQGQSRLTIDLVHHATSYKLPSPGRADLTDLVHTGGVRAIYMQKVKS